MVILRKATVEFMALGEGETGIFAVQQLYYENLTRTTRGELRGIYFINHHQAC